jgi:hypothetical protein
VALIKTIILDSTPLGLLMQKKHIAAANACRSWVRLHASRGLRFVVPEIVDYEVRRELLRLRNTAAVVELDAFNAAQPGRYVSLNGAAIRLAAELWAHARQRGQPTADPHALDIDVILAAQVLQSQFPAGEFVVATSNLSHLSQFVPAELWTNLN